MEFILIASAHFLALVSPGPDFFLILQAALRLQSRYAISVCAGIAAANGVYLAVAVCSLEAVRQTLWLMAALKYLGASYLIFVGFMLLRASRRAYDGPGHENYLERPSIGRQFAIGFMSGILNPKNIIFYLALFTAMVSPQTGLAIRSLYGLWMVLVVFLWDCGVVMVIGRHTVRKTLGSSVFIIEKIAGVMLTLFGLMLPFS